MPQQVDGQLLLVSFLGIIGGACCLYQLYEQQERTRRRGQGKDSSDYDVPVAFRASPFWNEVQLAVQLALRAGSNMKAYYDEKGTDAEKKHDLGISTKGQPEDFSTKIDLANEQLVTEGIRQRFPLHEIIGEESTGTGEIPALTNDPTWIIDPIDGTTNFAAGLPLSCVSIGFCVDKKPVVGVVYGPGTRELYLAVRGYGAYRNGVPIARRGHRSLSDAVVCTEFGYAREEWAATKILNAVGAVLRHGCRAVRQLGSGVLDMCYVATGRLDAVYAGLAGEGWKPWDYCAGLVIAEEAGCVVQAIDVTHDYEEFDIYSKSIICAVSRDLVKEIRQVISAAK